MDVEDSNMGGNSHTAAATANTTTTTAALQRDFFVVQKCWFSGPIIDVPVDYLRLLTTQQHAEEIACLSAHAFHSSSSSSSHSNHHSNHHSTPIPTPVRTIVLPHGGGYAFLAAGKIFWVRRLQATVVGVGSHMSVGQGQGQASQSHSHSHIHQQEVTRAHAVVTEHVIGGTGNRNSRRGQEVAAGRVFVGDGGASGQAAMVAAQQLERTANANVTTSTTGMNINNRVTWLPIGMPDENASNHSRSHAHLQEWPDRHLWVQQHRAEQTENAPQHGNAQHQGGQGQVKQQRDDSECSTSYYSVHNDNSSAHILDLEEDDDVNHVFGISMDSMNTNTNLNATGMNMNVNNMFMAPPAAKRQCRQPDHTVGLAAASASAWPTNFGR
jgi:hypothetical protein